LYYENPYHTLQDEKLFLQTWSDMQLCFAIQGMDTFFVGDPPRTPKDYLKRFNFSIGASATKFVPKRRGEKVVHSKRGPKGLKDLALVLSMFKDRFGGMGEAARFELRV
jgi:hypothetical protein